MRSARVGLTNYTTNYRCGSYVNPLECKDNYSATSSNMKLVHWPLMDGVVAFGTARKGLRGAAARPGPS